MLQYAEMPLRHNVGYHDMDHNFYDNRKCHPTSKKWLTEKPASNQNKSIESHTTSTYL